MIDVNIYTSISVVLEVETIVVHRRWRLKVLASASIYWGSPLESIRGVVLILDVNIYIYIYINFSSLGGGDHCSPFEVEIENTS